MHRLSPFITAPIVAEMIGVASDAQFLRIRDNLERRHGFPPPLPTSLRPLKWRRDVIQNWIDNQGTVTTPDVSAQHLAGNVFLLDKARTA
mgnify:CR=1 FL=1